MTFYRPNKNNYDTSFSEDGFTLIELMISVLIIGILAAIAIPVFTTQRHEAIRVTMVQDLRNAATHMTLASTEQANGEYPSVLPSQIRNTSGNTLSLHDDSPSSNLLYCLQLNNSVIAESKTYRASTGVVANGTC